MGVIQRPQPIKTDREELQQLVADINRNMISLYETLQQIQKALDLKKDA